MIVEHRLHRLARLASTDTNKRFDRLYREIARKDFLLYAYEQIKDNDGSSTPGIDGKSRANWTLKDLEATVAALQDGTYRPQPVRRVYIPKKSGKLRPLGIPTFTDRVVQSAVTLILEALYEPIFLNCSHGFRPNRSCHTAFHTIRDTPQVRMDWVVEGDIQGCFDNISHQILLRLLQKRIRDDRFLRLIAQFLKAGYFEREMWNPTKAGTPQGGIVSPILANIYLHEMDVYIEQTYGANQALPETAKERRARFNKEHACVATKIHYRRKLLAAGKGKPSFREEVRQLIKRRKQLPCTEAPIKPRITYVRYADDFVIVLRSLPKARAQAIKEDLTRMVAENLRLVLHPEKTAITHITDGFTFLSYKFLSRKKRNGKGQPRVKMVIPYKAIRSVVEGIRDICRHRHHGEREVLTQLNGKIRGWMNYYTCVDAPGEVFSRVRSRAWWAYAHYVAGKHRTTIAQAADRWIRRSPPTSKDPKWGPKTWCHSTTAKGGKRLTFYLINRNLKRKNLHDAALATERWGWGVLMQIPAVTG